MKKNKFNGLIVVIITIIILVFAFKDDFEEKINYIFSFNFKWLLCGLICVIIYWILKALVICFCARKIDESYTYKKAFKMILDIQFVNAITPFSIGCQPYQIYHFKKQGISLEKGTNIIIQDFVVYQIALILLGTLAIIVNYIFGIFPEDSLLKKLVVLGYLINICAIIILFIITFNKKGNKIILDFAIKIGAKIKIIKNKEKFLMKSGQIINNFHKSTLILMRSKIHFIKITFLNFIALLFLYLVPYTLIMGLGESINPLIVIVASAYVMLIGSFVPIPGGSGGIEYGFFKFFGTFISGSKIVCIMIVWRLITFYIPMIVGAISINKEE